jgi:enoyl-CoA hydratase/carnithine racemase
MSDTLIESRRGAALYLQINRPFDGNRIDSECMTAMTAAFDAADSDPEVKVIVVTGNSTNFCSGGRIDGHPHGTVSQQLGFGRAFCELQRRMGQARAALIAAVNGHCTAGGMSILAACDMAVATSTVEFGFPEMEHGLFPMLAMAVAHAQMPAKLAFDMFYSGRRLTPQEAKALNLVNDIAQPEDFEEALQRRINLLASLNPESVAIGRCAYHAMSQMTPGARLDYAQSLLPAMLSASGSNGPPRP